KKEKGFVTFDRPTQRAAKLVPYRVGFTREDRLTGGQCRAFVTMKQTTVPVVRSRLCSHVQISTQAAVLRREHTLDDLHFADRFGTHELDLGKTAVRPEHRCRRETARVASVSAGVHRGATEPVHADTGPAE